MYCCKTKSCFYSFISAITLLGTPSEVYVYGTQVTKPPLNIFFSNISNSTKKNRIRFQYCVFIFCFPLVVFVVGHWLVPVYYNLGVSTSYEV